MRDFVIIQAKKIGTDVWYRAVHVTVESTYSKFQPLGGHRGEDFHADL